MMMLASRNVVALPAAFPRPLWAGAGGGVRARSAPENRSPVNRERPTLARLPAPDPAPNPRPQGAGEYVRGDLQLCGKITAPAPAIANQRFRRAAVLRYDRRQWRNPCASFC